MELLKKKWMKTLARVLDCGKLEDLYTDGLTKEDFNGDGKGHGT
jgi:hypothetical protein